MNTWVLILVFRLYHPIPVAVNGYETRDACLRAGEFLAEEKLSTGLCEVDFRCIPGPKEAAK
jgi:hypothetical protein